VAAQPACTSSRSRRRASCATCRTSSRRRSPRCARAPSCLRDNVGRTPFARAARHRAHRARQHAVAAEADRGPARVPADARDGAATLGRSRSRQSCARSTREQKLAAFAR
jgi:hypothetical protein